MQLRFFEFLQRMLEFLAASLVLILQYLDLLDDLTQINECESLPF